MGLAVEAALARLAAGRDIAILSRRGLAAPFAAAAAATVLRVAAAPSCGLRRAPLSAWTPPFTPETAPASALLERDLFVDRREEGAPDPPPGSPSERGALEAWRLAAGTRGPEGFARLFEDPQDGETIWLRDGEAAAAAAAESLLSTLDDDLFTELRPWLTGDPVLGLRHAAGGAAALFAPSTCLDQPDQRQIDHGLAAGRAVFTLKGLATFALPRLGGGDVRVGATIRAPVRPALAADAATTAVSIEGEGPLWRLEACFGGDGPREADRLELALPNCDLGAEILECWTWLVRPPLQDDPFAAAAERIALEESW